VKKSLNFIYYPLVVIISILLFSAAHAETTIKPIDLQPLIMDDPTLHPAYDLYLLTQGRSIYDQLKIARKATLDKNMPTLNASLYQAQKAFKKLFVPDVIESLNKQQGVIQRDLKHLDAKLGDSLWVPVDATLSTNLVLKDKDETNQKESTPKKNNDVTLEVSDYRLAIFPLKQTQQNVSLAIKATQEKKPAWDTVKKLVKTAYTDVQWFFKVPTQGLASAYIHILNAATLAGSATTNPAQNALIIKELSSAETELKKSPHTQALQDQTEDLINKKKPTANDINNLAGFVQEKLRYVRDQSANKFMDESATESIAPGSNDAM